jgi:hypothetical protein
LRRISHLNNRTAPVGPGQRDFVNANVVIAVRSSVCGVKKIYSRQRTLFSRPLSGSAHQ